MATLYFHFSVYSNYLGLMNDGPINSGLLLLARHSPLIPIVQRGSTDYNCGHTEIF